MVRLHWGNVAALVAVSVVSALMLWQDSQHETAMFSMHADAEYQTLAILQSIRALLRWLVFLATVGFLWLLGLLCTRRPA